MRIGAVWCNLVEFDVGFCGFMQFGATWCFLYRLVQRGALSYGLVELGTT